LKLNNDSHYKYIFKKLKMNAEFTGILIEELLKSEAKSREQYKKRQKTIRQEAKIAAELHSEKSNAMYELNELI